MIAVEAIALGASAGMAVRYWWMNKCVVGFSQMLMARLEQEAKEKTETQKQFTIFAQRAYVSKVLAVNYLRAHENHVALAPWQVQVDDDIQKIHVSVNPITHVYDVYLDEGTTKPQ